MGESQPSEGSRSTCRYVGLSRRSLLVFKRCARTSGSTSALKEGTCNLCNSLSTELWLPARDRNGSRCLTLSLERITVEVWRKKKTIPFLSVTYRLLYILTGPDTHSCLAIPNRTRLTRLTPTPPFTSSPYPSISIHALVTGPVEFDQRKKKRTLIASEDPSRRIRQQPGACQALRYSVAGKRSINYCFFFIPFCPLTGTPPFIFIFIFWLAGWLAGSATFRPPISSTHRHPSPSVYPSIQAIIVHPSIFSRFSFSLIEPYWYCGWDRRLGVKNWGFYILGGCRELGVLLLEAIRASVYGTENAGERWDIPKPQPEPTGLNRATYSRFLDFSSLPARGTSSVGLSSLFPVILSCSAEHLRYYPPPLHLVQIHRRKKKGKGRKERKKERKK